MSMKSASTYRSRLMVFRSNRHLYVQIIDDVKGKVITGVSSLTSDIAKKKFSNPKERAKEIGKLIAQKASQKKIKQVTFDRRKYKYHGIVKELADGAREGGLEF